MAFWQTCYHLVWATYGRYPFITPVIEPILYDYIAGKSSAIGCITHAIGGIEDHLHLVVSIPPRLAVAEFVGVIKGSSSHHLNHQEGALPERFQWQESYGVFSLGKRQLEPVVAYVQNQKMHHQQGTTIGAMERVDDAGNAAS